MIELLRTEEAGKALHGFITLLFGVLTAVIPAVLAVENSPTPIVVLSGGGLIVLNAGLNALLSWLRENPVAGPPPAPAPPAPFSSQAPPAPPPA